MKGRIARSYLLIVYLVHTSFCRDTAALITAVQIKLEYVHNFIPENRVSNILYRDPFLRYEVVNIRQVLLAIFGSKKPHYCHTHKLILWNMHVIIIYIYVGTSAEFKPAINDLKWLNTIVLCRHVCRSLCWWQGRVTHVKSLSTSMSTTLLICHPSSLEYHANSQYNVNTVYKMGWP